MKSWAPWSSLDPILYFAGIPFLNVLPPSWGPLCMNALFHGIVQHMKICFFFALWETFSLQECIQSTCDVQSWDSIGPVDPAQGWHDTNRDEKCSYFHQWCTWITCEWPGPFGSEKLCSPLRMVAEHTGASYLQAFTALCWGVGLGHSFSSFPNLDLRFLAWTGDNLWSLQ